MKFGNVERFEIVVRRFDFRAFDDGEANGDEDVFDFLDDLADQVMRADGADYAGEGEIDTVFGGGCGFCAGFDGDATRFDLGFDMGTQFI